MGLKMTDFIFDETVENKILDISKSKNISFDECMKDLVVKAFRSQNSFDNTIKGNVAKRDFEIIYKAYFENMTMKKIADLEGISSTRIRQIICRGLRNMRIRLKIFLKTIDK